MSAKLSLHVEIVSDVICPWCTLGNARFDAAVQELRYQYSPITVEKTWLPFLLIPQLQLHPNRKISKRKSYVVKFGGDEAKVEAMRRQFAKLFNKEVLYNYSLKGELGQSMYAHRLSELAKENGCQTELMLELMRRYHSEGGAPNDIENLVGAARAVDLATDKEVRAFLKENTYLKEVTTKLSKLRENYPLLNGVPHFRVSLQKKSGDGVITKIIPGAQDRTTFQLTLQQLIQKAGYKSSNKSHL